VSAEAISDTQFIEGLVAAGVPEFVASVIASFGTATRLGVLEVMTTAVEDLTGRPPRTMSAVFAEALTPVLK
jgi:NAD(P)H dehydrogenase (quinone)